MYLDRIKNFFKTLNYKYYILFYILLNSIMPIVPVLTSKYLSTYFYMIVVVVAILYTFYGCRLGLIRDFAFLLIPFIIYEMLTLFAMDNSDFLLAGYQVLLFMLPICLGYFLINTEANHKVIAALLVFIFTLTAITTIIGCIRYPNSARQLASTSSSQDSTALFYGLNNIGGYGFVYMFVLIYPCVILAFKMKMLNIFIAIGYVILAFALCIYAEYTYAFLLVFVTSLLFFVKRDMSVTTFILVLIGLIAFAFIFKTVIGNIMVRIGTAIGNETMTQKMAVVFLGQEAVGNFDDNRDALYMFSIKKFLENPFFGTFVTGYKITGGHSFILDNLALYGLVGGGLMFLMYRAVYNTFYRPLTKEPGYCIIFWSFLQAILLSCINTGMWQMSLCLITPVMACAIYGSGEYMRNTLEKRSAEINIRPLLPKKTSEE